MNEMSSGGTTSISQLPMSNQTVQVNNTIAQESTINSSNNNNIVLTKNEVITNNNQGLQNSLQNPVENISNQTNYNEMIGQLQSANASGATSLPTRDIPIDPNLVNNDVEIKPNYIPQSKNTEDYINNSQTPENLVMQNNKSESYYNNLDAFYNEFQLPLLISVIYFLFQLPVFKKTVKKMIPAFFGNDGNPNLYGYFFNSILFSSIFYILLKIINQITLTITN